MPAEGALLSRLADAVDELSPRLVGADAHIVDIHHDSRQVRPDTGFVAIPGAVADGHDFIERAIDAGAGALVVEHSVDAAIPQLVVSDTRKALPLLAAAVHGHPSRALTLIGVTGTNGKTTVTHMLEAIAGAAGMSFGLVGTVGARINDTPLDVAHTTPESSDLQRLLARMRDDGVELVAIEVSSHALELGRVDAVWFAVAGFTNLSQDHLDFHGDMASYLGSKERLFAPDRAGHAVVWIDDDAGRKIASTTDVGVTTVGFVGGGAGPGADVRGRVLAAAPTHIDVELATADVRFTYRLTMPGRFNAANSLVAAACAAEVGTAWEAIKEGLEMPHQIPGRFEAVDVGQPFTVLVDYAHTPDAVSNAVKAVEEVAQGRVIVVVGAAGDRDPGKRAPMGAAASFGDVAIVTSDNPRSEDPQALVDEVVAGTSGHVLAIVDRREAIEKAVALAEPRDVVLILGKGHEQRQEFADHVIEFDDKTVATEALVALGFA